MARSAGRTISCGPQTLIRAAAYQVEANLDFGIVTQESTAKRTLRLQNNGQKEAKFELEAEVSGVETKVAAW